MNTNFSEHSTSGDDSLNRKKESVQQDIAKIEGLVKEFIEKEDFNKIERVKEFCMFIEKEVEVDLSTPREKSNYTWLYVTSLTLLSFFLLFLLKSDPNEKRKKKFLAEKDYYEISKILNEDLEQHELLNRYITSINQQIDSNTIDTGIFNDKFRHNFDFIIADTILSSTMKSDAICFLRIYNHKLDSIRRREFPLPKEK